MLFVACLKFQFYEQLNVLNYTQLSSYFLSFIISQDNRVVRLYLDPDGLPGTCLSLDECSKLEQETEK